MTVTGAVTTFRRAALVLVAALLALGAAGQPSPTPPSTVPPEPMRPFTVTHDVKYGTAGGQDLFLDAYVPDDNNAERVSVFLLHGGGWRLGDKRDVVDVATRMARRGWVVFAVNYRLNVPEAFPAEIDDVQTAVKWARLNAYDYRLDPGLMGALGFSAGGHLAAMLATLGDGPPDRNARILVGASWSGPMDLTALAAAAETSSPPSRRCSCPARRPRVPSGGTRRRRSPTSTPPTPPSSSPTAATSWFPSTRPRPWLPASTPRAWPTS